MSTVGTRGPETPSSPIGDAAIEAHAKRTIAGLAWQALEASVAAKMKACDTDVRRHAIVINDATKTAARVDAAHDARRRVHTRSGAISVASALGVGVRQNALMRRVVAHHPGAAGLKVGETSDADMRV